MPANETSNPGVVDPSDIADLLGDDLQTPDARQIALADKRSREAKREQLQSQKLADKSRSSAEKAQAALAAAAGVPYTSRDTSSNSVDGKISSLLPEKDRIRIYVRDDSGKLSLINDYSGKEVAIDGDVSAFVNKRLRPTFGDREFVIYLISNKGDEIHHSTITRMSSLRSQNNEKQELDLVRDLIGKLDAKNGQHGDDGSFDRNMKMIQMILDSKAGGAGGGGSSDSVTTMMMLPLIRDMMKEERESRGNSANVDILKSIMDRLERIETRRSMPDPMVPQFPPIGSTSSSDDVDKIMKLAEILKPPVIPPPPQPEGLKISDIASLFQMMKPDPPPPPKDPISMSTILASLPAIKSLLDDLSGKSAMERQIADLKDEIRNMRHVPEKENDSIEDQIERLLRLKNATKELLGDQVEGQPRQQGGDFWTAAGGTLANVLSTAKDLISELRSVPEKPKVSNVRQLPAATQSARPAQSGNAQDDEEEEEEGPSLKIDDLSASLIRKMAEATEDQEVIERAFDFVRHIGNQDGWSKYVGLIVVHGRSGNKESVLEVFDAILGGIASSGHVSEVEANRISGILHEHIDLIIMSIQGRIN